MSKHAFFADLELRYNQLKQAVLHTFSTNNNLLTKAGQIGYREDLEKIVYRGAGSTVHNVATEAYVAANSGLPAHNHPISEITGLQAQLNTINALLTSDNVSLDTLQEIVDAVEVLQALIVNDLTTGGTTKALSAQQGVVLKGLIDAISSASGVLSSGEIIDEAFIVASPPAVRNGFLACVGQTVDGDIPANTALRTKLGSQFITNTEINRPPIEPSITLTSNSQSGYISSASTTYSTFLAWQAFEAAATAWWSSFWTNFTTPPTSGGEWVKLEFPTAILFSTIVVRTVNGSENIDFKLQASNNNSTWTDLGSFTNVGQQTVTISDTTPYKYYRVLITRTYINTVAMIERVTFNRPLYSPIRFFQTPNLSNPATGVRRVIKL